MRVALVHDYLTQRGGAERVVLSMVKAFPEAPLLTSVYEPESTYPEFREIDVRTLGLNRFTPFRSHHRLALPFLARAFRRLRVDADVVLCSSSGWAHGVRATGVKVVYCHNPARWLYQTDAYVPRRFSVAFAALTALRPYLVRWDRAAARGAVRYLANSTATGDQVRDVYGIEAEVLPPPPAIEWNGYQRAIDGVEPGYFVCVSRLLPYKNVDRVVEAFTQLPSERLLVVGTGPEDDALRRAAPPNVRFLRGVGDDELRWLYANAAAVVAASYEDFGLTPLEGAAMGTPAVVLRRRGFLETVDDGLTGVFFDEPEPGAIAAAIRKARDRTWDAEVLIARARQYSEPRFIERLREVVYDEVSRAATSVAARETGPLITA